ncbi:hypothetical protein ANCCAN_25941 [Ancylostoma caninum]|uniref:Uncharacterized protein n=1 Tax=Ancylostoma caninum TaxID=29170 RepID=A0A368FBW4_ANCCA|nr:hypothetical protein ANCCAN_25941 [Ancylostoma caninum]
MSLAVGCEIIGVELPSIHKRPAVTDAPKYLGHSLTIYYKHHIGAYSGVGAIFSEVRELLPAGATTFGIYYDNPRERDEHLLQSAVGVIFAGIGQQTAVYR